MIVTLNSMLSNTLFRLSMIISPPEARKIVLASQRLGGVSFNSSKTIKSNKAATLAIVQHLGYIQIDTLAVIARAHHHVLWSRHNDYQQKYLDELLREKKIFEYWSHAAAYLPMSDYRFTLPLKAIYAKGKSHWFAQDLKIKKFVLDRIKKEGGLQSKDFEFKDKTLGNWYGWKPAKRALHQLVMEGKLMVAERKNFHKIYDLTEQVLPSTINTTMPSDNEYYEHLILTAINANGIVTASEMGYQRSHARVGINKNIKRLLKEGLITEIKVNGIDDNVYYGSKEKCAAILNTKQQPKQLHILSPFDNLVIQRKRLQQLFNFNYVIECYLPAAKRQHGYFCLPVLYGDSFVARFDPKVDRTAKTFHIRSFHAEKGCKKTAEFNKAFAEKIKDFAEFNGCGEVAL